MTPTGRAAGAVALLLLPGIGSCVDPVASTRVDAAQLIVALTVEGAASGSPAAAFDKADRLTIRVLPDGGEPVERTCALEESGETVQCGVDVVLPQAQVMATIGAELGLGPDAIFAGEERVALQSGAVNSVELAIEAVPDRIEVSQPSVQIPNIGQELQLDASVVFVTGDPIPDLPVVWSTTATGIDLTPTGLLTALENGSYVVEARSGELSATVDVTVAAVATITSVSPSSVPAGRATTLTIEGANLHGASSVSVCGWAFVDAGAVVVAADGSRVDVPVLWRAYASDDASPQEGATCLSVDTPQGLADGSVDLVQVGPPPKPFVMSGFTSEGVSILYADPAAGELRELSGGIPLADHPRLSPDGSTVTIGLSFDGTPAGLDVFRVDVAGGGYTSMVVSPYQETQFVYDPTGSTGVYRRCDDTGCFLWDLVGSTPTKRAEDGCNPGDPEFRQPGQLLYSSAFDGGSCAGTHRIQRATGGAPVSLAGGDPCCSTELPRLSPDGTSIGYRVRPLGPGSIDLYTMDLDGSNQVLVRSGVEGYAWASPEWIFFTDGRLRAVNVETGEELLMLEPPGFFVFRVDQR